MMKSKEEILRMITIINAFGHSAEQLRFQCEGDVLEVMTKTFRWVLDGEVE